MQFTVLVLLSDILTIEGAQRFTCLKQIDDLVYNLQQVRLRYYADTRCQSLIIDPKTANKFSMTLRLKSPLPANALLAYSA